jgi:hypothetical protein
LIPESGLRFCVISQFYAALISAMSPRSATCEALFALIHHTHTLHRFPHS